MGSNPYVGIKCSIGLLEAKFHDTIESGALTLQRFWIWSKVLNFFLGGSASSLYLYLFWSNIILKYPSVGREDTLIKLIPAILATLGLFGPIFTIGKPSAKVNFTNPIINSNFTKETFFALLFIALSIGNSIVGGVILAYSAFGAAILLIFCQGIIFSRFQNESLWNSIIVLILFFTTGGLTGYGLWIFLRVRFLNTTGGLWITWGVILISINLLVLGYYLWIKDDRISSRILKPLRAKATMLVLLDGGIPLLALLGIYFSGLAEEMSKTWVTRLGTCGGISLCLCGWIKFYLFLKK